MKRILLALVVLLGLVAMALAPSSGLGAIDSSQQPSDQDKGYRTISRAVLGCPELSVAADSASTVTGLVTQAGAAGGSGSSGDRAGTDEQPGTDPESGTAALRAIDSQRDLARLPGVGDPVNLLVAERSEPPILLQAEASWAPGAVAGVASREVDGSGAGLASAACPAPSSTWWFVGAGSQLGRGAALLVSNPAQEAARFDIALYAKSGPVDALGGKGIDLGPQSHVRLRLDALAPDQDVLAVQVRATTGRVAAALRDVAVPKGDNPRGVDFIPAAIAPTTTLWIGGIPEGTGARDLVLVNPGTQFATVHASVISELGTTQVPGLAAIAVPAGSVVTVELDALLDGSAASLALESDVPVTGGVRATWGGKRRDLTWLSATPLLAAPTATAAAVSVPAGEGLTVSVTVVAPEDPVSGELSVISTGTAEDSIYAASDADTLAERAGKVVAGEEGAVLTGTGGADVQVLTWPSTAGTAIPVVVPAGQQRTITIPEAEGAALVHLAWQPSASSGPALLSHLVLDDSVPLATGYSWWPIVSAVSAVPVREDVGVLAPVG